MRCATPLRACRTSRCAEAMTAQTHSRAPLRGSTAPRPHRCAGAARRCIPSCLCPFTLRQRERRTGFFRWKTSPKPCCAASGSACITTGAMRWQGTQATRHRAAPKPWSSRREPTRCSPPKRAALRAIYCPGCARRSSKKTLCDAGYAPVDGVEIEAYHLFEREQKGERYYEYWVPATRRITST